MSDTAKPTINDVARIANVSKKTVSRVINKSPLLSDKTRAHVQQVIASIGYVPNPQARALALRRNFVIAAIHDNPNAQFLVNVQQGILEGIAGSDFGLMVQPVDRKSPTIESDIREFLERQRPYGVVLLPPISEDDALARQCAELGVRYVRMGSIKLDTAQRTVTSNDRQAAKEAVAYLIAKGHRHIGLVEGPAGFTSPRERRAGFEEAMADAGLTVDSQFIWPGEYTFESGVNAGQAMVEGDGRPTAVFACNDEMAIGVMIAARRAGLAIPADLSIVGFDDTPLSSHVWPNLTTVHWPITDMARNAAQKLIAAEGAAGPGEWLLPSQLVERDSVIPPKS